MPRSPFVPLSSTTSASPRVGKRALLVRGLAGAAGLATGSVGSPRKAYPFSPLATGVGKDGVLDDRLGGQIVRIRYDAQHRTARAGDGAGKLLPSVLAFWFAWVAFHPQTELLA